VGHEWAAGIVGANAADNLHALRAAPAEQLLGTTTWFKPVMTVDGWFLPAIAEHTMTRGQHNQVPLMVGTNQDEGAMFMRGPRFAFKNLDQLRAGLKGFFAGAESINEVYPAQANTEIPATINQFITDVWFLRASRAMLRAAAGSGAPTYQFTSLDAAHRCRLGARTMGWRSATCSTTWASRRPSSTRSWRQR